MNPHREKTFCHFKSPQEIPPRILERVYRIIVENGQVGKAYIRDNLKNAFLIAYATDQTQDVIGTVVLKRQKPAYRKRLEAAVGLDLSNYLERGYTAVKPAFRDSDLADRLIKGLIDRSRDQKVYVTIGMDNIPALKLTRKNGMIPAGRFFNERTGREIGVFINRFPSSGP